MPVFETPGSVSLEVKLQGGRVVVTTADEPRTAVEVVGTGRRDPDAVEGIEVSAAERAGGHVITIEEKDRVRWGPIRISWGGDVEVRITCPPGSGLDLSGGSTDLRVEGALGEVSARTASGDVRLGAVGKKLQVKTASGDISVATVEAEGALIALSGDLAVGRVEGALTARTLSGDLRIGGVHGPLALTTTSGDVVVESVEAGEVRIQTVSGDVRLAVGRGTSVFVDAASVSGDLGSELGIADEIPGEGKGPVVPLHVKTVSGDVAIVRAAEAYAG